MFQLHALWRAAECYSLFPRPGFNQGIYLNVTFYQEDSDGGKLWFREKEIKVSDSVHQRLNLCPIYKFKEHKEDRKKAEESVQNPQCLSKRKNDIQGSDYVLEDSYYDIYFTKEKNQNKTVLLRYKKIRDTKVTFHAKMGLIKDRNGMDLTEAEDIKKRRQEYTKELYKKDLHDPDNHDAVITHLEPDILECEVKWALESITNKQS